MQNESLELSLLSIFSIISFFTFFIIQKISNKIFSGALLDSDFNKPQAFHNNHIPRSGGLASIISFFTFIFLNNILFSVVYLDYLILGTGLFLIGFLDDIKVRFSAKSRLIVMVIFLYIVTKIFSFEINQIDLIFLQDILKIDLFFNFFIVLCFLFIINGSNLIDGFNGLLSINLIIINIILTYINMNNGHLEFSILIISQIIILLSFLLFNFPNAKIFLGDSGAYTMGALVGLNTIITNNLNPEISSFFFCTLLFYLFFEVFFSFLRKLLQKKSPIYPDDKHLHMLSFYKISVIYGKNKGNYLNSIIINFFYLILIIPGLYLLHDPQLSRYWFFILLLIYLLIYSRLYRFTKN